MLDLEDMKKLPPAERIKKLKELEEQMEKEKEIAKRMIKESISEIEQRQEIEVIIESERRVRKSRNKEDEEELEETLAKEDENKERIEEQREYGLRIKTNIPGMQEIEGDDVVDEIRRLTYIQGEWKDTEVSLYNQIKHGLQAAASYEDHPESVMESLDEAMKALKAMGYKRMRR